MEVGNIFIIKMVIQSILHSDMQQFIRERIQCSELYRIQEKSGKTTLAAHLENNLIIDLEGGSEFIDCLAVQARNINDLGEIANAIRQKNKECN